MLPGGVIMEKILDVAQCIYDAYLRGTGEEIDEMKLHKLLYFSQRESFALLNKPLFNEKLEGWVHGPVSPLVHSCFSHGFGINADTNRLKSESERIVRNIICEYGHIASWKLRDISHDEISWKNSRMGLNSHDRGSRELQKDDIKEDAKKIRPFDYTWGMYYDELDDYDGELLQ